jgi:hypothetical protein
MSIVLPNLFLFGFMAIAVLVVVAGVRLSHGGRRLSMAVHRRECPACKEAMRRDASICPHCRTPSEPWTFHDNRWWIVRNDASYYLDEASQTWMRVDPATPPERGS